MQASESVTLQEYKFPERSALLFGREQVDRSYPFDRFHLLRAGKGMLPQDYKCCRLGRVCCCKILCPPIEVLCYWDGSGRDCPVGLLYILKDFALYRLVRVCPCKIINSLSEVPCCLGGSGMECQ